MVLTRLSSEVKVTPGDTLRFEVEIVKLKKMAGIGKGIAYVGDKKVAEAEMTFMFKEMQMNYLKILNCLM